MISLPVDPHLPRIAELFSQAPGLIFQASPGSGKSTRVPPALLSKIPEDSALWVLEPRRLAALWAARRVSEELGTTVGEKVGYHFRFDRKESASTRILFLTEGTFLRRFLLNPTLKGVAAVVLDEFHERHLQTDLAFGLLRRLQTTSRPDLKLVIMSATLDFSFLKKDLENFASWELELPPHPLTTEYADKNEESSTDAKILRTLKAQLGRPGDFLVFLPGNREILSCERTLLGDSSLRHLEVRKLYGSLSRAEQDLALSPSDKKRVVLCTNIAESSLTVPGVRNVIDSGLYREASFSHWNGMTRLETQEISKASALQRAGRANREGPGYCFRLYSKLNFDSRSNFSQPEFLKSDLSQAFLELYSLGIDPILDFPWPESLPQELAQRAQKDLILIEAITEKGGRYSISPLGRRILDFPLSPRFGKVLAFCEEDPDVFLAVAKLAAKISVGPSSKLNLLELLREPLNPMEEKVFSQLNSSQRKELKKVPTKTELSLETRICRAFMLGFPDRVAQKRRQAQVEPGFEELLLSEGGTLRIPKQSDFMDVDFFVVVDVQEMLVGKQKRLVARTLLPLEEKDLWDFSGPGLKDGVEVFYDASKKKVFERSSISFGKLSLEEHIKGASASDLVSDLLFKEIWQRGAPSPGALHESCAHFEKKFGNKELEIFLSQLSLFAEVFPERKGELGEVDLGDLLREAFEGKVALSDFSDFDWSYYFKSQVLSPSLQGSWEGFFPRSLQLGPKKKSIVAYALGQKPWVESRLQDFFGLKEGPSILQGRLKLTLHLLAPNMRPLQVTQDLKSFWTNVYPEIRPALSRRYPRHQWPENPLHFVVE